MIEEKLSTELLLQIIKYLRPNEKKQGLLICKTWYPTFLYALYHTIKIETPQQLELLFKSLSYCQFIPNNGYYTKTLIIPTRIICLHQKFTLQERIIIPQLLFEKLPDYFPNLEVLNFDPATWKFISFNPKIINWKKIKQLPVLATLGTCLPFLQCLGQNLSFLSLQSGILLDVSTQHRILSIFSLTPYLKELSILEEGSYVPPATLCLTLQDIELIHTVLPYLESFTIIGERIEMLIGDPTTEQLTHISQVPTQLDTIKKIHWDTSATPVTWIHYIIHKYPYIKDLTLSIKNSFPSSLTDNQEYLLYNQLVIGCRHLEKISLSCPVFSDWFNSSFFQSLSSCVRQVQPVLQKENRIRFDTELELAIQPNHRHLITALEIEQWRLNSCLNNTLNLLTNLSQLYYLELKCDSYNKVYNMETVLQSCPLLNTLVLEWGSIIIPTTTQQTNNHSLKSFIITYIAFEPNLFQYLSTQCKLLSTICLTKCKQLCKIQDIKTHTVIEINMPQHTFDLIMLQGIRLDYANASLYSHGLSNYIALLSIQKQNTNHWYRHVGYTSIQSKSPVIQQLDRNDVNLVETYFKKRQQFAYKHKEVTGKLRMEFGFIQIKCQSLKHFVIDGDITF